MLAGYWRRLPRGKPGRHENSVSSATRANYAKIGVRGRSHRKRSRSSHRRTADTWATRADAADCARATLARRCSSKGCRSASPLPPQPHGRGHRVRPANPALGARYKPVTGSPRATRLTHISRPTWQDGFVESRHVAAAAKRSMGSQRLADPTETAPDNDARPMRWVHRGSRVAP